MTISNLETVELFLGHFRLGETVVRGYAGWVEPEQESLTSIC